MPAIDSATAYLAVAAILLLLPLQTAFALAPVRSAGVVCWCGAGLVGAIGLALIGLRGQIPNLLSYHVGFAALVACQMFTAHALMMERGVAWPLSHPVLLLSLSTVVFSVLHAWAGDRPRLIFTALELAVLSAWVAWQARKLYRAEGSVCARALAATYLLLSAALALRAADEWINPHAVLPSLSLNTTPALVILSGLVAGVVAQFSYVGLVVERTARMRVISERQSELLQEARALTERLAQRDKDHSLEIMAGSLVHELTQPLTAVLAQAQVVQRMLLSDKVKAAALTRVFEQVEAGIERAARVLEGVRSLADDSLPRPTPVVVGTLVLGAADLLHGEALRLGVSVTCDVAPGLPAILGNETTLSQVMLNLLKNALEASEGKPRREVRIEVRAMDQGIRVQVRDFGPGFSELQLSAQDTLFQSSKAHGLGMGLAISRAIVKQHAGRLGLQNAPDGGAVITLELPEGHP